MLVLKRKPGQRLILDGGRIIIEALPAFEGDMRGIKLGITAPPGMIVDREEVHQQRQAHPETPNGRR